MKRIEDVSPEVTPEIKEKIYSFWSRNVNCEKIMGENVSSANRGSSNYFEQLERQRYRSHQHLMPWIKSMEPGKSVLEIGCGIGLDSFQMAKHGLNVTAVDLTDVAIQTVQARFQEQGMKGNFRVADATNLEFKDESFDYVYSFGVLHHASDTIKAINEVFRVLKQGGEARIMLYNRHSLNEFVHRITGIPFEDKDELCPVVRRFNSREVSDMFGHFKDIKITKDFVYGEGYGLISKLTPSWVYRILSSVLGWHLMIRATK